MSRRTYYQRKFPTPPPASAAPASASDSNAAAIARIDTLSRAARPNWFALLGYFAFAIVTLLGVKDADFFIEARQTQLPLINVAIPTASFFVFAPILGAALYVYFHFQLLKLWQALSVPDPVIDGRPLAERVEPSLINDFGLWLRGDGSAADRALGWLSHLVTFALVFVAGPAALIAFWVRSFPARDERTTLVIGASLIVALTAFLQSLVSAFVQLRMRRSYGGGWWHGVEVALIALLAVPIGTISWVATEDGRGVWPIDLFDRLAPGLMADTREAFALWPADLSAAEFTVKPADWLSRKTAEERFRYQWCSRRGLDEAACPTPRYVHEERARVAFCQANDVQGCKAYFKELEKEFSREWREQRSEYIATLTPPDLGGRDLRGADLSRAFLVGASLFGARLEGATLEQALLEEADLGKAALTNADLTLAGLEAANLSHANLAGSKLTRALLTGAKLWGTDLRGASLSYTDLVGASGRGLGLEDAFFSRVRLASFSVSTHQLDGAAFWDVDLSGKSPFDLSELEKAFGDGSVRLPENRRRPAHWPEETLTASAFFNRWRGWREAKGLPWPPPGRALARHERSKAIAPGTPVISDEILRRARR